MAQVNAGPSPSRKLRRRFIAVWVTTLSQNAAVTAFNVGSNLEFGQGANTQWPIVVVFFNIPWDFLSL